MRIVGHMIDLVEGVPAVDLQDGANNGDWISLKNNQRVAVVFVSGLGTGGDDPTLTIQQAQDNGGTGSKALNFTEILTKQAATDLSSTGQWTRVTQSASNTYTDTDAAEQSLIWVVEFEAADLDVDNGFDHLRATVADIGSNAQPGYIFYIPVPLYGRAPEDVVSSL